MYSENSIANAHAVWFVYPSYSVNMNQKIVLYVIGGVLLLVGVLGFVMPSPLLGIFAVNMLHNLVHVVTGLALLAAAYLSGSTGSLLVKIFAVVYALVALAGIAMWSQPMLLGLIEVNPADHILHVVLAGILIWLGFFGNKSAMPAPSPASSGMGGGMNQPPQGPGTQV